MHERVLFGAAYYHEYQPNDRLELVKGTPSVRRGHLDQVVAALWPFRVVHRRAYAQALAQRNALLGRLRAGGGGAEQLRTWSNRPWNSDGKQLPLVHHASVGIEVKFRDFGVLSRWVGEHVAIPGRKRLGVLARHDEGVVVRGFN